MVARSLHEYPLTQPADPADLEEETGIRPHTIQSREKAGDLDPLFANRRTALLYLLYRCQLALHSQDFRRPPGGIKGRLAALSQVHLDTIFLSFFLHQLSASKTNKSHS